MTMMLTFSHPHVNADNSLYEYDNDTDESDDNDREDNCDE